jgi:hypothetical protein
LFLHPLRDVETGQKIGNVVITVAPKGRQNTDGHRWGCNLGGTTIQVESLPVIDEIKPCGDRVVECVDGG